MTVVATASSSSGFGLGILVLGVLVAVVLVGMVASLPSLSIRVTQTGLSVWTFSEAVELTWLEVESVKTKPSPFRGSRVECLIVRLNNGREIRTLLSSGQPPYLLRTKALRERAAALNAVVQDQRRFLA